LTLVHEDLSFGTGQTDPGESVFPGGWIGQYYASFLAQEPFLKSEELPEGQADSPRQAKGRNRRTKLSTPKRMKPLVFFPVELSEIPLFTASIRLGMGESRPNPIAPARKLDRTGNFSDRRESGDDVYLTASHGLEGPRSRPLPRSTAPMAFPATMISLAPELIEKMSHESSSH